MLRPLVRAGGLEHAARKVPKVDGLIVGDEEDLAVDPLVVQRRRGQLDRLEQRRGREQVRVRHVADVGEVEQVLVVAELEARLARLVDVVHGWDGLHVAFAEDAGRAERGCEERWVRGGAVGGEDEELCFGLLVVRFC